MYSFSPIRATCPPHLILLDLIIVRHKRKQTISSLSDLAILN
jgi:hypothetical protein